MNDPGRLEDSAVVTIDDVRAAARTIAGAVEITKCEKSRTLSSIFGADIWLKFENHQFTASFKERGALNRLSGLGADQRALGVIAMSAGNHAQGVAYHAQRLGIAATIVMPIGTPTIKVESTRSHGAKVILEGATLEDSAQFALQHGAAQGLTFIHPYDDPLVIAGQGTISLEMLAAAPDLDVLIVPIGGGGLISGMAVAAKSIKPGIQIIGVQTALYPSMFNILKGEARPVRGETLAEGIAVKAPGRLTSMLVERWVDDIVLVSETALERAISLLVTIEKSLVEGAGAAGLAAVLTDPMRFAGRNVGLVLCGGNIDTRLLTGVLTRELAREGRLTRLSIDLVDRPGQLARVSQIIGDAQTNILEVHHQRVFTELPAKGALLQVVIETRDRAHLVETVSRLRRGGFEVEVESNPGGVH